MDILHLIEQLASTTHYNTPAVENIIKDLPFQAREAFLTNNMHQLRQQISGSIFFPDSRMVVRR